MLPDLDEVSYLAEYWHELGMIGNGAFGPVQLSSQEILSWSKCSAINLCPWEFRIIRGMSSAYIEMLHKAEKTDVQIPYGEFSESVDREKVSKDIKHFFQALKLTK